MEIAVIKKFCLIQNSETLVFKRHRQIFFGPKSKSFNDSLKVAYKMKTHSQPTFTLQNNPTEQKP